jgi:cell division protein FtsL
MRPGRNPTVNRYAGEEQPLGSPAQTANIAGAFADPLGLIDIFGKYPAFPEEGMTVAEMAAGPRSPSLAQNIADKEYLTAIIQLAGAIPAMAPVSKAARQALRAYHGTPHRFPRGQRVRNKKTGETYVADLDSPVHQKILESGDFELIGEPSDLGLFDMSRIGQGEGAQAYGRGLYFAEAEPVAKGYQEDVKNWDLIYGMNNQLAELQSKIDDASGAKLEKLIDEYEKVADARELAMNNPGSLYTVDIDVDLDELLDYDIPLSEQSDFVKDALKKIPRGDVKIEPHPLREDRYKITGTNWRGGKVNRQAVDLEQAERVAAKARGIDLDLEGDLRGGALIERAPYEQQEELANTLREAGIKGIKYLDRDSRFVSTLDSGKDLTSNYVIFDDELIKIVDRKREGGAVMQPFVVGLDPTIDIFDDPRDAEPLLTPAQAANVGGGFTPGAGLADVLGLYPAFPDADMTVEEMAMGPRAPSLMQNVMEGNLLDSALQLAGGFPVIGGVAKSARVARGIRSLPIDEQIQTVARAKEGVHGGESVFAPDLFKQTGTQDVRRAEDALKSNQSDLQTIDQMVERAESVNTDFQQNIADIASTHGAKKADKFITLRDGSPFDVEVKTRQSIDDKIQRKGLSPDQFTDGVRTSVYVDSAEQAEKIASEIGQAYPSIDRGWQVIPETGYFDRKMNVAITDPKTGGVIVGEVQIKTPEMAEAGVVGHRWYEISRKLEGRYNKDIPPQKYRTYVDARAEQQRIYGGATDAADPNILDLLLEKFRLGGLVAR